MAMPPPRSPEWLPPNPHREEPISKITRDALETRKYYRVTIRVVDETGNGEEMEVFKTTFNIQEDDSPDIEDIQEMFKTNYEHTPLPKLVVNMKPAEPAPDWPVYTIRPIEHS